MRSSLIMDVVPKRRWTISLLFLIIIVSLIMIFSGSLDGAAAWANILALPVAIIGVILTLRTAGGDRVMPSRNEHSPPAVSSQHGSGRPSVNQIGFANRDQINVAHEYVVHGGTNHGDR
jgi:hypothetical protein